MLTTDHVRARPSGRAFAGALLAALALAPAARAYRPFDGTDASVAELGEVELEIGPAGLRRAGGEDALIAPHGVFNWGLFPRCELVIEGALDHPLAGGAARVADAQANLKVVLREGELQHATGLSLALEAGALLPGGGAESGLGAAVALIASKRLGELTLHLNGLGALDRGGGLRLTGGLIGEGPAAWAVRPVVELLIDHASGERASLTALAGAIWKLSEAVAVDGALRAGRAPVGALWEARLGLTWTLGG